MSGVWFKKSYERGHPRGYTEGHPEAQYTLAECYYNGKGVEKDFELAVEWYKKGSLSARSYKITV